VFVYFIVFVFGLATGSFLNSVVYRLNEGGPIFSFKTRSFCPSCKHTLAWRDLIPLASFFVLRGRCRFCKSSISRWYPIGELSGGLFFLTIWFFITSHGLIELFAQKPGLFLGLEIAYLFAFGFFLLGIFLSDFRYFTIPDIFFGILIVSSFVLILINNFLHPFALLSSLLPSLGTSVMGGIIAFLFFFPIVFFSHEKLMGWGDVKYGIFMGVVLGWPRLAVALYLAFIIGALIGLALILAKQKTLKSEVPFGVFLVPATLIGLFEGEKLWCAIWPCV
jgi:leader peptidase (prepilin peptidase)/N-methyltransferase